MKVRLFDTVVAGQGIGGLVAALMLQKRHAKVAILTKRSTLAFDPDLCEFLNGFALKPALKRIGFHPAEVNAIPTLDAPVQLVFDGHRVDCHGDEGRFQRELEREFPERATKIIQLFRESYGHLEIYQHLLNSRVPLPPRGFFARRQYEKSLEQVCDMQLLENRELQKELSSFDVGDDFARAVEAMQLALYPLVSDWTCGAHLAHLLTLVRWEGYSAPMGLASIRRMLLERIRERGGVLIPCDEIREVHVHRGRISGFSLDGCEFDDVGAGSVIVAGDPRGLIAAAREEKRMREWLERLERLPIAARKGYQAYRVASGGIPIGMKPQGLIVPPGPPAGRAERRQRVRAIRYVVRQVAREGKSPEIWLGLTAFFPPDTFHPEPDELAKEIREAVGLVTPFLERHILDEPSPLHFPVPEGRSGDFREGFLYRSEKALELGVSGFAPDDTPFENVFLAGDNVFPGLGLDGQLIAGLQATHYAGRLLKKDLVDSP